jgi:23S rRNA G2445 N2-methylase RlmL
MYELLVGSRFANRVYLSLAESRVTDFDALYALCESIEWGDYLSGREYIVIEGSSTRSTLSSVPTIQSIGQKSIFSTLTTPNTTSGIEVHILILIIDDIAHILLDVTGDPLHKRWYRHETGEAPIKENLAAALVAFANWKYRTPIRDPFCGSGTIAIEAAMIARNIAPGTNRHFRIESLPCHSADELTMVRNTARLKAYPSGEYQIYASDIDPDMIRVARANADRAGVIGDITFSTGDFLEGSNSPIIESSMIVTNPPYGKRLESIDLHEIYTGLIHHVTANGWGFITSHPIDVGHGLANRKLLNGSEECRYWYKK